ncbi:ribosomal protection-like ABC-F family protein [Streptomyces sp. A5-4]|uniref:ribosomal protection-like ABC-F family protein n=1 Tax=Streptomyces sp. A5-4 TaxID=3384771 RepID=UPI003DA8BE41
MAQLVLKDVSKAYGDRSVLDQVSLTVRPGEKVGVIGENGSGKSTLLRLMAGSEHPDTGSVTAVFPGGRGHLAQTPDLASWNSVQDAVDAALADLRVLEARIREAEATLAYATPDELASYGDLLTSYEGRGGYRADARVDAALHGLGLAHLTRERSLGSLSGGERSRLALACVLAAAPELLLLDEPTNHLDRQGAAWLEEHVRAHRGTVVTVTHDRAFLSRVTDTILKVDRDLRDVTRYGDGWDGYRTAKAAARHRWAQDHQEWLAEMARTDALLESAGQRLAGTGKDPREGFGKHRRSHEAKLSGHVRAARQRLQRLRQNPVPAPPRPLRFRADLTTAGGGAPTDGPVAKEPVAELSGVRVGNRLHVPGLRIEAGERLLVSGPNGAGKTTLLRVIAGDLQPDDGVVRRPERLGYLPQELPSVLPRQSLLAAFARGLRGPADEHAEELLALGLFREEDLAVPVPALSVGQQRRLELARLVTRPADLLILDEPTNHVSLTLVEELEEALSNYRGAVVVVSHDRRFQSGFTGNRLELDAGRPTPAPLDTP